MALPSTTRRAPSRRRWYQRPSCASLAPWQPATRLARRSSGCSSRATTASNRVSTPPRRGRATSRRSPSRARPVSRTRCGRWARSGSPTSGSSDTATRATTPDTPSDALFRLSSNRWVLCGRGPSTSRRLMKAQGQKYLAELFGTFILVFVGSAAIIALLKAGFGAGILITVPLAFGFGLMAGLYAFAEVSGGHFNPAVSLALFLDRRLSVLDLVAYWLFQFVGAVLASAVLVLAFNKAAVKGTTTVPGYGKGAAVVFEIVLTAIFVLVILQVTKSGVFGSSALIAIPLTLVAIHVAAIPVSGASVNPARTLAPALIGNKWDSEWIYFLGPAAGAILGWLVHTIVVQGDFDLRDNVGAVAAEVE